MGFLSRLAANAKENFTGVIKNKDWEIYDPGPFDVDPSLNDIIGVSSPITRSQAHAIVRWASVMRDLPDIDEDPVYAWLWEEDEWERYDYEGHLDEIFQDELYQNIYRSITENVSETAKPKSKYRSKYSMSDIFK